MSQFLDPRVGHLGTKQDNSQILHCLQVDQACIRHGRALKLEVVQLRQFFEMGKSFVAKLFTTGKIEILKFSQSLEMFETRAFDVVVKKIQALQLR